MIDQILGLLLIGLGLQTPKIIPQGLVKGDTTETQVESTPTEDSAVPKRADLQGQRGKQPMPSFQTAPKTKRGEMYPDKKNTDGEMPQDRMQGKMGSSAGQPKMADMRRDEFAKMGSPAGMEKFREELKTKRAEAMEAVKAKREEFKTRLENIKDETKKKIVENMDQRLSEFNTKRTEKMTNQLTKMEEILGRAVTAVNELKAQGKDTSTIESAISEAQAAIASAKTAVSTQASKEYVPQVLSEDRLKSDVGQTLNQMQQDLKATESVISTARDAVKKVIEELAIVRGETQ